MSKPKEEKNINVPNDVLRKLLTPSEVRMLKNRWQIINLLEKGLTIREIAEQAKVGTDTVMRVSKMKEGGIIKTLKIQTSTPWIFGKGK